MKDRIITIFRKMVFVLINIVVNTVYRKKCLICSDLICDYEEGYFCLKCKEKIRGKYLNICEICSIELGNGSSICGQCEIDPPPFRRHVSYTIYKDEMRKLILLYKLSGMENLKYYISGLYKNVIDMNFKDDFDIIIPVPSDPGRKSSFKHVSEIARILSKYYGKKLSEDNLIKRHTTNRQSSLNYNKRIKNLNNAFKLTNPEELRGKSVLLIDDVYTTGTTIKKCSHLLRKKSKKVYAVTLARSSNIFLDR